MVIRNGEKWACARCIRGHRVSSCQHQDRQLQHVAKKGRPISQCAHCRHVRKISRSAHVRCDCGEKQTKCEHLQRSLHGHRGTCCCNHGGQCSCSSAPRRNSQPHPLDELTSDDSSHHAQIGSQRRRRRGMTASSSSSSSASPAPEDLDRDSDQKGLVSPAVGPISPAAFNMITPFSEPTSRGSPASIHDPIPGLDAVPPRSQTESPLARYHGPPITASGLQLDTSAAPDMVDVLASPFSAAPGFPSSHSPPPHSISMNCGFDPANLFLLSSFASLHDPVEWLTPTTPLTPADLSGLPTVSSHPALWSHSPDVAIDNDNIVSSAIGRCWDMGGPMFEWGHGHAFPNLGSI